MSTYLPFISDQENNLYYQYRLSLLDIFLKESPSYALRNRSIDQGKRIIISIPNNFASGDPLAFSVEIKGGGGMYRVASFSPSHKPLASSQNISICCHCFSPPAVAPFPVYNESHVLWRATMQQGGPKTRIVLSV